MKTNGKEEAIVATVWTADCERDRKRMEEIVKVRYVRRKSQK